jgi:hypothetical protein
MAALGKGGGGNEGMAGVGVGAPVGGGGARAGLNDTGGVGVEVDVAEEGVAVEVVDFFAAVIMERSTSDSTPGYLPSPNGRSMSKSVFAKMVA